MLNVKSTSSIFLIRRVLRTVLTSCDKRINQINCFVDLKTRNAQEPHSPNLIKISNRKVDRTEQKGNERGVVGTGFTLLRSVVKVSTQSI